MFDPSEDLYEQITEENVMAYLQANHTKVFMPFNDPGPYDQSILGHAFRDMGHEYHDHEYHEMDAAPIWYFQFINEYLKSVMVGEGNDKASGLFLAGMLQKFIEGR